MQKDKEVTIVLWGRTGAGKSTLGNRLANGDLFQVGHSLKSQTSNTSSKTFDLRGFKINVIDTPGFGDNRAEFKDTELLAILLKTLKGLEGGFNLGIFCIPATKTRIDGHDLNEIRMLGTLLGHNVFAHTIIALTQIDTLSQSKQKEVLEHLPKQIPPILEEHGFTDFSTERILVSNFDNFNKDFVEPFLSQIAATDKYTPEISKDIDLNNPDSLSAVMASPHMRAFLDQQKALLDEKVNELSNQKALYESLAEDNKIMQASANRANQEISQLRGTIENLQKYQNSSNELIAGLAALVRTGCVLLYDASRKMWVKLTRTNLYWTTQGSDVNANYWYLVAQNSNGHWNSEGKFILDHGYFAPIGGTDWVEMQHGKVHCYFKRVN